MDHIRGIKNQNDILVDSNTGIQNKAMGEECLQNSQGRSYSLKRYQILSKSQSKMWTEQIFSDKFSKKLTSPETTGGTDEGRE